jgi:hypothetical protein
MQLPIAHVDREDARGSCLEEAVREPARRRADVGAVQAGDLEVEGVEGVTQLLASTRDEGRRLLDDELDVLRDLLSGLGMATHAPGEHERLRLRARLGEAALVQHDVQALLHAPR